MQLVLHVKRLPMSCDREALVKQRNSVHYGGTEHMD